MITRRRFFPLESAFDLEGALALGRARFWMFITPVWAPENKAWVCISFVEGVSALDDFGDFVVFTAAPLRIFFTVCVAEHEMRQHSCQDFLDSYDHSAEWRCYAIHHCRAVFLCRFFRMEWLLIFPLLVIWVIVNKLHRKRVVGKWSVSGRYVVGMWSVSGWYVVGMWSVSGR